MQSQRFDYALADTTAISHLTKASVNSQAYSAAIGTRRLAISFQTRAELESANFTGKRKQRLNQLLAACLELPHNPATNGFYAQVADKRRELRKKQLPGSDASDGDIWIISNGLEYGLPLLSHDDQQVHLARAVGMAVWTNLPTLVAANPTL